MFRGAADQWRLICGVFRDVIIDKNLYPALQLFFTSDTIRAFCLRKERV